MSSVGNIALNRGMPESNSAKAGGGRKAFGLSWILAASLLGGCASYSKDHLIVGSVPDDYRTKHPIVVSDSEVFRDLPISSTTRTLSLRHRNVVREFAMRFKRSGASTIRMVMPVGSRNEMAAKWISKQIAAEFRSVGIRPAQIMIASYQASEHGDAATLRLVFNAMTAEVASECGVWEDDIKPGTENKNYGNYGCATQNNLASMVANPNDLLGPRGESEIDATRRDWVIQDWRENGSVVLPDLL